jgi:hypothetical protein
MKKMLIYPGLITILCTIGCVENPKSQNTEPVAEKPKTETVAVPPMAEPKDGNVTTDTAAVAAAKDWLALVDAEKYGDSWDEAAQYFKNAVTKEKWVQAMEAMRKPFGKNLSRELASQKELKTMPGAPDGEYVVIQFKSSFENKKSAVETITPMMDKDGKWRVSGYFMK